MPEFDPHDPEFQARMRAQHRAELIEQGIPEESVDELLDMAAEFGKAAAKAVEEFERNGGRVVYEALCGEDPDPDVSPPWDSLGLDIQDQFVRAFAAAVDFIDEETYDPSDD